MFSEARQESRGGVRRDDDLQAWMTEAVHSRIKELVRFARGLRSGNTTIAMRRGRTAEVWAAFSRWARHRYMCLTYPRSAVSKSNEHPTYSCRRESWRPGNRL